MKREDTVYRQYLSILHEELRPAMGCTEPIALAYTGAIGRQLLGGLPEEITAYISGMIIKNVKSVIVPNTGHLHGIAPAICAGVVAGDAAKELQVISNVTDEQRQQLKAYLESTPVNIYPAENDLSFDIDLRMKRGDDWVRVRTVNHHTNLVYMEKNGQVQLELPVAEASEDRLTDKSCLNTEDIVDFADSVE